MERWGYGGALDLLIEVKEWLDRDDPTSAKRAIEGWLGVRGQKPKEGCCDRCAERCDYCGGLDRPYPILG